MRTFVCQECKRELAWPLVGPFHNYSQALCQSCFSAGHNLRFTTNTKKHCKECGRAYNTAECYYCARGIKEEGMEYLA